MTALGRFEVLEAAGFYAESRDAPPREVLVTFGNATLTILSFDETPIAHWPLGALAEIPGSAALTLAPDVDAPERLTLDDRDMIAAIRAVRAKGRAGPRRSLGRGVRRALAWGGAALAAAALWFGLQPAVEAVAALTPPEARAALGEAAIADYAGVARCRGPAGERALELFAAQVSAAVGAPVRLAAVNLPGAAPALPAPGGWIVLHPAALDSAALTLAVAQAIANAREKPPTGAALRAAGGSGLIGLLTGRLDARSLTAAAVAALRAPPPAPPQADARVAELADAIGGPALDPEALAALTALCR
jgi:hypothetical protein